MNFDPEEAPVPKITQEDAAVLDEPRSDVMDDTDVDADVEPEMFHGQVVFRAEHLRAFVDDRIELALAGLPERIDDLTSRTHLLEGTVAQLRDAMSVDKTLALQRRGPNFAWMPDDDTEVYNLRPIPAFTITASSPEGTLTNLVEHVEGHLDREIRSGVDPLGNRGAGFEIRVYTNAGVATFTLTKLER